MPLLFAGNLTDAVIRYKAPRNMMFNVESVACSVSTALATNYVIVTTRWLEDEIVDSTTLADVIAAFASDLQENFEIININETAKYLSIGKTNAGSIDAMVLIYGTIKRATKMDLLIEWFRRGR